MRKAMIKPLMLRSGESAEVERHATWLELFFALLSAG